MVQKARQSPFDEAVIRVKGEHRIHKEAWHHASDYHTGCPETSESAEIKLHLLLKDGVPPNLSISYIPIEEEEDLEIKNKDRYELTKYGRRVMELIANCDKKVKEYHHTYASDGKIPEFGDLNDLDSPSQLIVNDYFNYEEDLKNDSSRSHEGKDVLYFDKKIFLKALTKVRPGKLISIKGYGRATHLSKYESVRGLESGGNPDSWEENHNNKVKVIFRMYLSTKMDSLIFVFKSKSLNTADPFTINSVIHV